MSTTYLCGGINGLTDSEATDWRTEAKRLLKTDTLDPMRRDYRGKEDESVDEIGAGDLEDINNSDFLLVNATRPSFGTAMEIVYATLWDKTIYAVVAPGPISPWLRYHVNGTFTNLQEACDQINRETQ